jgi:hypothetical protein
VVERNRLRLQLPVDNMVVEVMVALAAPAALDLLVLLFLNGKEKYGTRILHGQP